MNHQLEIQPPPVDLKGLTRDELIQTYPDEVTAFIANNDSFMNETFNHFLFKCVSHYEELPEHIQHDIDVIIDHAVALIFKG